MGILDFFKKKGTESDKEGGLPPSVAKWNDKALDKRAQTYERVEAIYALCKITSGDLDEKKTDEARYARDVSAAVSVLMKRLSFSVDPSITDQEEKDIALEGIIAAKELAVDPVRKFADRAESLAWPIRILKVLLEKEAFTLELLEWLSGWDTEYAKFVDPKLQLLSELEEHRHPNIAAAVLPFLDDVNETARFHAVGVLLAQDDPSVVAPLATALKGEESVRVKNRAAQALVTKGWVLDEAVANELHPALPMGYSLSNNVVVRA